MKHIQQHSGSVCHSYENGLVFQEAIDQIVYHFFINKNQNKLTLLSNIHEYTRSKVFLGSSTRLSSLAILINHLLKFVPYQSSKRLFIVSPTKDIYIKELNATLSLKLEIGEWKNNDYYILKKFVWGEADRQLLVDLIIIYCNYAYIKPPKEIEIFDLYAGVKTNYPLGTLQSALNRVKLQIGNASNIREASFYLIKN